MKIAQLLQEHAPNGAPAVGEIMGTVSQNVRPNDSHTPSRSLTKLKLLELGDPEVYAKFFYSVRNFALSPESSTPVFADSDDCATE